MLTAPSSLSCRQAATRNQIEDEDALPPHRHPPTFIFPVVSTVCSSCAHAMWCHFLSAGCQAAIGLFLVVPVLFVLLENQTPVTFLPVLREQLFIPAFFKPRPHHHYHILHLEDSCRGSEVTWWFSECIEILYIISAADFSSFVLGCFCVKGTVHQNDDPVFVSWPRCWWKVQRSFCTRIKNSGASQ